MNKIIDLRSDTVTQPTPAMREAMYRAEVGDDVFGEDPTVNRLEELAAEKVGKEASLFVVSGTMGNLVSIVTHCQRGDEVIIGDQAHAFYYEVGGSAVLGGLPFHPLPNRDGMLDPGEVEAAIRADNIHMPRTGLVCLENTHNRQGGVALTPAQMDSVIRVARRYNVPVHLDGARIFNAAVALGLDVRELTRNVDSVMFCLSKGLSAPVGSMVAGDKDYIQRARKYRKMVGGGLRQAGILAAAGIVALTEMVDRLAEDHETAQLLAQGLSQIKGLISDPQKVQTNIVVFEVDSPGPSVQEFVANLAKEGVKVIPFGGRRLRAVTHYGIGKEDIFLALAAIRRVMAP